MIGIEDSEKPLHKEVLKSLTEHLQPLLDSSIEGVFIYLDGEHKVCNEKLAKMFGYTQLQWEEVYPFEKLLSKESRVEVMATYYERIVADKAPGEVIFTGVRKDGSTFKAHMLMVPFTYEGLLFALCFVTTNGLTKTEF